MMTMLRKVSRITGAKRAVTRITKTKHENISKSELMSSSPKRTGGDSTEAMVRSPPIGVLGRNIAASAAMISNASASPAQLVIAGDGPRRKTSSQIGG